MRIILFLPLPRRALLALIVMPTIFFATAMACPFCEGDASGVNEVKAGIFNESFWPRVGATLLPFPVLAVIVALIYFGPPGFRQASHRSTDLAGPSGR